MKNQCNIPKNSNLFFGSGGSQTIIAITPKKQVYKYFPLIVRENTPEKNVKQIEKSFVDEINNLQKLTKYFVKTNKTPHLVKLHDYGYCNKIPKQLFSDCMKYSSFLQSKKQTTKKCEYIYRGHPTVIEKGMYVANLEFCDGKIEDSLGLIMKKSIVQIKLFLDKLLFQIIFTLEIIRQKYPGFRHNDLFIRNIMTVLNNESKKEYNRYIVHNKVYDVPADGLFIKINDFGLTRLNDDPSIYKDWFNILYDLYNGSNLGGKSLSSLTKNETKIRFLKKYFNQFMNVSLIDKIIKNNKKGYLDWNWNIAVDKEMAKLLKLQTPKTVLSYFAKQYIASNDHAITHIFGS